MKFLIGLLLGIGIAAGVAFYLNKAQSPFIEKDVGNSSENVEQNKNNSSAPLILAPGTKMQVAASGVNANVKENTSAPTKYDFYDVLEGKKNLNSSQPGAANNTTQPTQIPSNKQTASKAVVNNVQSILDDQSSTTQNTAAAANGNYILQAGAFANSDSANDLKAHLALSGYPAKIISKQNSAGAMINRIVIGPYSSLSQAQSVKSELQKQNIGVTIINLNQSQGN